MSQLPSAVGAICIVALSHPRGDTGLAGHGQREPLALRARHQGQAAVYPVGDRLRENAVLKRPARIRQ